MRVVVLGAGPLGVELTGQLVRFGHEVTLRSVMGNAAYDMPGTSPVGVDGTDSGALAGLMQGAEVVYLLLNAHYVDWYDLFPPRLDAAISAAQRTGARLVYHDGVYLYGPSEAPLTEESPQNATSRKGRLRSQMAQTFMAAVASGRIAGTIGRSADIYGPGALNSSFNSTLGQRHFIPVLAGRAVPVLGDADAPHTYGYVPDVAAGLVTLGTSAESVGQVWHLPAAETLSHRELLTLAFDVVGRKPRIRSSPLSAFFLKAIGAFQKDVGEVAEVLEQFQRPLVVSHEKYARAFPVRVTGHRDALAATLDWYRSTLTP